MKKTIYTLAIAVLAVFGLSSCDKYLDRKPLDSNSDATNWTSESAIETYSWKFYDRLSELSYGDGWTRGQYHADTYSDDYVTEGFNEFTKNVPNSSGVWNTNYDRIREANIMLSRIDQVPGLSEAAANHWKGVAKFFRAIYYFNLVKTYGDVVWVDAEVDFAKEENVKWARTSRVTVIANVLADLDFAVENCYEPAKAGVNTVNNMVAAAFQSRVALYEAAWEKYHNVSGGKSEDFYKKAKSAASKVMSSNLYEVTNDYKGMYTSLSLAGSKEVLLYKIYTLANVNGGKVTEGHAQYGWSDSSTPTWGLSKSAVENYTNANGIPTHMYAYDDQTLAGVFANRDKRLNATVYEKILPIVEVAWDHGILSTTGYWTFKFMPLERRAEMENNNTWNAPSNDTDGPIFTYAEVLENYAEACAELGNATQADLDNSVNLLRTKHGQIPALKVAGTGVTVGGTAITKDPNDPAANVLLQELRRDRRSELMCDGFRHDDLMRWALGRNLDTKQNPDGFLGASEAALKAYYMATVPGASEAGWTSVKAKNFFYNGYKSQYNTAAINAGGTTNDRVWNDKYYLEPIPAGQILLDNNLTQNPGWE